ncbi:MAG: hypothetical protein JJT78_09355 [Leptospira sp.]|nr:hypothetical protein [Leptospira sp.]
MKRNFALILIFCIYVSLSCGGGGSTNDANSLFALLPKESGDDGLCTVSGLGSQVRAGFTVSGTEEQPVRFQEIRETSYAVVLVKGANVGTVLEISSNINPDIYATDSCPIETDRTQAAESGKDYTLQAGATTNISFLKRGSYAAYFQIRDRDQSQAITTKISGTPTTAPGSSSSGVGNLTFNKSCTNDGLKTCTNLYGNVTTCDGGETEGAEICSKDNVFGVCRVPSTGGYKFISLYTSGWSDTTLATGACTAQSGTFSAGYSEP